MATLKTSILLELQDKFSKEFSSLQKHFKTTEKASTSFSKKLDSSSSSLKKGSSEIKSYNNNLKQLKPNLESVTKIFAGFATVAGSFSFLKGALEETKVRELANIRLGTVIGDSDKKEFEKYYKDTARTGLAGYEDIINTGYNLLSAGLGDASKEGAKTVLEVAKVTGGQGDLVASSLATASKNFGLSLERVGDLATKTQLKFQFSNFAQLDEGLKNVGASAASVKLPLEQTLTSLGMLNDAGVTGSNAGTALNALLRQLGNAQKLLGIDIVRDKGGNLDLLATLKQIDNVTKGLDLDTKASVFQQVFGDEGKRGVLPLIEKLDQFSNNLEDVSENSEGIVNKEIIAFLESYDGKVAILNESFKQFKDSIGKSIKPVAKVIIAILSSILFVISDIIDAVPFLGQVLILATGALFAFITAVTIFKALKFASTILGIRNAFVALRVAIMAHPLIAIASALAFVALLVIANWDKVKQWFVSFGEWFKTSKVFELIQKGVELVKGVFGGNEVNISNNDVNKVKEASAIGANGTNASNTNNNQKINVTINSASANPEEIAEQVMQKVGEKQALSYAGS